MTILWLTLNEKKICVDDTDFEVETILGVGGSMVLDEGTASRTVNRCPVCTHSTVICIGRKRLLKKSTTAKRTDLFRNSVTAPVNFLADNVTVSFSPHIYPTPFHLLMHPENLLSPLFSSLCVTQTPVAQWIKITAPLGFTVTYVT
jgi:hypothetical protein